MLISEAYHWPPRALGLTMVLSSAVWLARGETVLACLTTHIYQSGLMWWSQDLWRLWQHAAQVSCCREHKWLDPPCPPPRSCFLGAAPAKGWAWWGHEALLMRYEALLLGNWPEDSPSAWAKLPGNWAAVGSSSHPNLPSLSPFTGNRPAAWSGGSTAFSCSVPLCLSQMPQHNKFIASPVMPWHPLLGRPKQIHY